MTDQEYIQGFRNNDERVVTSFYDNFRQLFFAFFRSRFSKDDAYIFDLFQDACVVLWQNIHQGKLSETNLSSSLSTYFLSVGRFTMMAKDRKFKEIVNDSEITRMKIIDDDAESLKERIERDEIVLRTVSEMKPPCDSILKAHYWDKLSGTEIAVKYGYSNADSVKTQKSKCIKKLRAVLEKIIDF